MPLILFFGCKTALLEESDSERCSDKVVGWDKQLMAGSKAQFIVNLEGPKVLQHSFMPISALFL